MRAVRNIFSAALFVGGLTVLSMAIWEGLPILGIDLLAHPYVRASLIIVAGSLVCGGTWLSARARRRAAEAIEANLLQGADDADVLAERMQAAVAQLKSKGGTAALYDLPWYILIGPPGAGKTTALLHSGIEFPDSDPEALAGFAGTRNCEFWFAREAVLIDTAGRYTTQDSDAVADRASWIAFLDQLKTSRPDQPINGVILTLSCADLIAADPEELRRHAETAFSRLRELHQALKVRVPVYVMFTKADMLAGFREYFGSFDETRRRVVWGATFPKLRATMPVADGVAQEFSGLVMRLNDEVTDRMAEELDSATRISIFGFPTQFAGLEQAVTTYLDHIFGAKRGAGGAVLRGFYFTSGTQQGTPIDQVLGTYADLSGMAAMNTAMMSGRGRSYFLHDLLRKVIFAEQGIAGFDRMRMLRRSIIRGISKAVVGTALFGVAGALAYSFWIHASLISAVDRQTQVYDVLSERLRAATRIENAATRPVLQALESVRAIPTGYGAVHSAGPVPDLGLSRVPTVRPAAIEAYSQALERLLRPRMMLLVERQLVSALVRGDDAAAYSALKVYMLLAKAQDGRDDDLAIQVYFARAWAEEYATPGSDQDYSAINRHLAAMLELDDRVTPLIQPNKALVERARMDLAQMPVADQLFGALQARASAVPPVRLADGVPGLQSNDGRSAQSLSVSGLYTYDGYWRLFQPALADLPSLVASEAWVLGQGARAVDAAAARAGLLERYADGYAAAWAGVLARVSGASGVGALVPLAEAVVAQGGLTRAFEAETDVPEVLAGAALGSLRQETGRIQMPLTPWMALLRGPEGQRPVDDLHAAMVQVEANPELWPAMARGVAAVPELVGRFVGHAGVTGAEAVLARDVLAECQARVLPFYPFAPVGSAPLPMADFASVFSYGGQLDRFWQTYGAVQGAARLPVSEAVAADFEAVEDLRAGLFAPGSAVPDLPLRFRVTRLGDRINSIAIDLGQGPRVLRPGGEGIGARWPSDVRGFDLILDPDTEAEQLARVPGGAWSLISLIRGAREVQVTGNRVALLLEVRDAVIRLEIEAEELDEMPLALPVWRDFSCPAGVR